MKAPQRLLDLDELPLDLQKDLRAAQQQVPYDTLHGLAEFTARLDHSIAPSSPHSAGGPMAGESMRAAGVKLAQGSYWVWGVTGIAATVLVGAGVFAGLSGLLHRNLPKQSHGANEQQAVDEVEPADAASGTRQKLGARIVSPVPVTSPVVAPSSAASPSLLSHDQFLATASDQAREDQPRQSVSFLPVQETAPRSLKEELAELRTIRKVMASAPEEALSLLTHSSFRQGGVLEQERMALQVEALKRLDRIQEATQLAHTLVNTFPDSPAATRFGCLVDPSGVCSD